MKRLTWWQLFLIVLAGATLVRVVATLIDSAPYMILG
jgi:hypothetical protein